MEKLRYYWNELKKRPLAYNLTLVLLALVTLAVAAHILMQVGTRHGARRTVPDFAGVPLGEAQHLARKHDLRLFVNDSLYFPAYEGGIILDQLPEKGIEVKPGRTVYITINSFKQKMVPVPYVAGRSLRQAKNMLEIAGLGIEKLVYRADIATNYVLSEFCDGKQVTPGSRIETEMGSGVTLHVGVAGGYGTTVMPRLIGLSLRQAKSRLWELGLNVGEVVFDDGINTLNQKEARVYAQNPGQERSAELGSPVNLRLTLDTRKAEQLRGEAEKAAKGLAGERLRQEREEADSLARLHLEQTLVPDAQNDVQNDASDDNDIFF